MSQAGARQDALTGCGPFSVSYVDAALHDELAQDPHTLALIGFKQTASAGPAGGSAFDTGLPQINGDPVCEYWRSPAPVERLESEGFRITRTPEVMFASRLMPEGADIAADTRAVYGAILQLLETSGYPHLLRVWNYFPHINAVEDGTERYQAFCVGRHQALSVLGTFESSLPAASALGSQGGGLQIYFLAARSPGVQIENPRQVSAFRYPERYSPRSPSFSRATLKHWDDCTHLYISGTASIVGHESVHDDPLTQLHETLENIAALIGNAHDTEGLGIRQLDELSKLKVYLRNPTHADVVRRAMEARLGDSVPTVFLHGDVCRSELLLEIEGLYTGPHP